MTEDSFLTLQTAIAGVIASAGADHMLAASQIIDDFLDPEVDAAEKRGAVKVLRRCAAATEAPIPDLTQAVSPDRLEELRGVVRDMRSLADRIESGDVTP